MSVKMRERLKATNGKENLFRHIQKAFLAIGFSLEVSVGSDRRFSADCRELCQFLKKKPNSHLNEKLE
jgi:hypothetical protein